MTNALTTTQKADIVDRLYELEFGTSIPVEATAKQLLVLIMAAAEQQIDASATRDSPWSVQAGDDARVRDRKAKMRQFQVAQRALQITEHRRAASELVQVHIVAEIQKRKLYNYPADGTWVEMADIVREILPESRAGSVVATVGFLKRADSFDALGLNGVDTVATIAAEKKYMLGRMQMALNKVIDDNTPPTQKKEAVKSIIEDAASMTIPEFESTYLPPRTPPIPYSTWSLPDGSALHILHTTDDQRLVLRKRMNGMLILAESDIFRPVTAGRVRDLMIQAAKDRSPLLDDIRDLLKSAVLATPIEYSVYSVLDRLTEGEKGQLWADVDTVKAALPAYNPVTVLESLAILAFYGLVEEMEVKGSMKLWRAK